MNLYHLSDENHHNEIFKPIPMTWDRAMYGEDCTVNRTCFSNSIQGAINALVDSSYEYNHGHLFYVHTPYDISTCSIYKPNEEQVPDCMFTHEYWITSSVHMICIGQIQLTRCIPQFYQHISYRGWKIVIDKYFWKWIHKFPSRKNN